MNNPHKKILYFLGSTCAVGLLFLVVSPLYAQGVPVSFAPPGAPIGGSYSLSSAGGSNYCFSISPPGQTSLPGNGPVEYDGNYVPTPSVDDPNPVGVLVAPDGNNYGIRGSYTAITPNCSSLSGDEQTLCQSVSAAFSSAVGAANKQTGFPQGRVTSFGSSYAGNNVSLQVGAGICGIRNGNAIPLCESAASFPNASGGKDIFSYIYFDTASLNNSSGSDEFTASNFENNTSFARCDFAHELTHTFGLSDIYNSGQYPGLMGNECANIFSGEASDTYPNFWSPNEAATVTWLNAGKPLITNPYACNYTCTAGQSITFIPATQGTNAFIPSCQGTTADEISCDCQAPTPYCTDLNKQETVAPPTQEFCANQNLTYCTCPNGQPSCFDGNGSPAQTPATFSCDAPKGETTETIYGADICNCNNGSPACEDGATHQPEPTPVGFSCSDLCSTFGGEVDPASNPLCVSYCTANPKDLACPTSAETASLDYACDDNNACVMVTPGTGQYLDATCDDECGY